MGTLVEVVSGNHSRREGGRRVRYGPGDGFEATDKELAAFGDKLKPVERRVWGGVDLPRDEEPEGVDFDVAGATVDEVLEAVEAGTISAAWALDAERAGQERVTLVRQLEAMLGDAG